MRRINFFITISAFSFLMLCLPGIASAQYDPYSRTGGYNSGGYSSGSIRNNRDMRSVISDLKRKAGQFQREIDQELDHSRHNGTRREDQINQLAREFKIAAGRLNSNIYNDQRDLNRALELGVQIDRTMGRGRVGYRAQGVWSGIRADLDLLRIASARGNGRFSNNRASVTWPF